MWDEILTKQIHKKIQPMLEWVDGANRNEQNVRQARDLIYRAESRVSKITAFRTLPQSAPWHAEGPMLIYHIERMLCGLYSVLDESFSIFSLEEYASEKHLFLEFQELQETIREQAATLEAFILLHDIAKISTISFEAPEGSKSAHEGFAVSSKLNAQAKIILFGKLVRAFAVTQAITDQSELAAKFFDEYQIRVHFQNHAKMALTPEYARAFSEISDLLRLTARDRELLIWLIEYHIDTLAFFRSSPDRVKYDVMRLRATKAHLDADDVLDLALAGLFIDTTIGARVYENGLYRCDIAPVLNMLRAEEHAVPERKIQRLGVAKERERKVFKELLARIGLDASTIIEELQLPFDSKRAIVLKNIHELVKNVELPLKASDYPKSILDKIQTARALYQARRS